MFIKGRLSSLSLGTGRRHGTTHASRRARRRRLLFETCEARTLLTSYQFLGGYRVYDGPVWYSSPPPPVYSAREAAAALFGGSPYSYVTSTDPSSINFKGWYDGYGDHVGHEFDQDFRRDAGAPGYTGDAGSDYSAYVRDGLDNTRFTNYVWRVIDDVAPVTTSSVFGTPGNNGWYVGGVSVTLSASDDAAGVAATYYSLDGGPWQSYGGVPLFFTSNGAHTLGYWSIDHAGNYETHKSFRSRSIH